MLRAASWMVVLAALLPAGSERAGVIEGSVVSSVGATPIAGAQIVVAKLGGQLTDYRTAETDNSGRFVARDLSAGSYRVYAERDGFFRGEHGRRLITGNGTPVTVTDGQQPAQVTISMTPPGVITGRVLDRGKPAQRVVVRALKPRYFDGQRTLQPFAWAETDDRGEYRLFGLEPGPYFVSAIPPSKPRIEGAHQVSTVIPTNENNNQRILSVPISIDRLDPDVFGTDVYLAVFNPGTTDLGNAVALDVSAGGTVAASDLTVVRAAPQSVRGSLTVTDGDARSRDARVAVQPVFDGATVDVPAVETKGGEFTLSRVPPGRYLVVAQTTDRSMPRLGGVAEIEVGATDLNSVVVQLGTPVSVTGRVRIDGRPVTAADPRLSVQLQAVANAGLAGVGAVQVQPDGTFVIPGPNGAVFPGTFRVRVLQAGRAPWLKSARYGSDDVTYSNFRVEAYHKDRELELDISTATASVDAVVVDNQQRPVAGALVVAVPDQARRDRSILFKTATTDAQGRVRLGDVAPGEYRLFATVDIEANGWQDPSVIRRLEARGEIVRLAERGSASVTLRLVR